MKKTVLSFLIVFLFPWGVFAQTEDGKYFDVGIELQQYSTGFLFGVYAEIELTKHHAIDIRIGYNLLDHQDFGEHEDEEGGGFGFTLSYQYYFNAQNRGCFLGARTDLWFNKVDWKDNIGEANEIKGTTKVVVFQPTAIAGYRFLLSEKWVITPTLALGAEINVKTKGAAVGQGPIFIWGINMGYQF